MAMSRSLVFLSLTLVAARRLSNIDSNMMTGPFSRSKKKSKDRWPIPQDEDGTPVGIKCTDADLDQIQEWMNSGIASFDDDKAMVMRCSTQNYVFTAQQAATLIGTMTWNDNQVDAVEMFRDRLTNPTEDSDILSEINGDEKSDVKELLMQFKTAKVVSAVAIPSKHLGVRDDDVVNAFAENLDFDIKEAAEEEMRVRPSPPFSAEQLETVLNRFTFASELPGFIEALTGPGGIYPLTCAEIDQMIGQFDSSERLELLKALKPLIKDAQNKPLLVSSFEFADDKNQAELILRDVMIHFQLAPPVLPPLEVKEMASCFPVEIGGTYQTLGLDGWWHKAEITGMDSLGPNSIFTYRGYVNDRQFFWPMINPCFVRPLPVNPEAVGLCGCRPGQF